MRDIINTKDNKGRCFHGYQERYYGADRVTHRGVYVNGDRIGYCEWHDTRTTLSRFSLTIYHIK